jgi:hypothetical protein
MAMSKQFAQQVTSLATKGAAVAKTLQSLGAKAVKAAYANQDKEQLQFMFDNLPQYMRVSLAKWVKRAGIEVIAPAIGSSVYIVQGVLDSKRQSKAFEFVDTTPVITTEHVTTVEKVKKPLEGTAETRAAAHVGKLVKKLQESDSDAAVVINDTFASKLTRKLCIYDAAGVATDLSQDDYDLVMEHLLERRLAQSMLKAA